MQKVKIIMIYLVGCLIIKMAYGNMLVFRNLCMVKGPVEGTDKKGHGLAMEKIGVIGDPVYGIPIYVYWNSGHNQSSPYLGYGWRLPIAESCIVPLDANHFEVRRPDGGVELVVRDRKDKNKLRGRRYWRGEIRGEEVHIYTLKDCRHGQSELIFRNGRLVRFKDGETSAVLVYRGKFLECISFNGKEVLRLSRITDKTEKWQISIESKRGACLILGQASIPLAAGKKMTTLTLKEIVFPDGSRRPFAYGVDAYGNGTFKTLESSIVWDAKRRVIIREGDWTYEVKDPKPEWNNVPIRRFNKKGEAEGKYYDIRSGIQTEEIGYVKIIMRLFTSGMFKGKVRWCESYYKGVLQGRGEYAYDENGRLVYIKGTNQYATSENGKKVVMEKWCEPNGHVLKTRKNGDDSTIQEYVYTPEGRLVAVVCGDKIVSECVGNSREFVAWYKAKQRGENTVMPKIVERHAAPRPKPMCNSVSPDLLKELRDERW